MHSTSNERQAARPLSTAAVRAVRGLAVAAIAAAGLPAMAQMVTPTQVINSSAIPTPGGLWLVSASHRASYCQPVLNGSNGSPLGRCVVLGALGASAAGYAFALQGTNLMAISKSSGAIFSCTLVLLNGTTPMGGCAQISTLAVLE